MPWYRGYKSAEGSAVFAVELTEDEFKAVKKFCNTLDIIWDEGWSGSFGIHDEPYNTREEIVAVLRSNDYYCNSDFTDEDEDTDDCEEEYYDDDESEE